VKASRERDADPMPPATATTKNGALSCPIRNDRTGRLDKATPRCGLQCSGANCRQKQNTSLLRRADFRPEALRCRPQVQSDLANCPSRINSWMPAICASPPNDVLARVSILSVGLDADNRLHPVSGSSSSLTPAASARALTIAAAVGPGAASLVPRKGCPGRSQQRRGGAQGRRARRTRPGVSAQSILVCDFAAVGGGWWRFWTITRRR
jgi:hypothetical protein